MSRLTPDTPAPFPEYRGTAQVKPLIESVNPEIRSWFNTRDAKIIETSYNTCTGQITTQKYPWNIPNCLQNKDIWPCPIQLTNLFWQYGTQPSCECDTNRCGCSNCYQRKRCALYGGSYTNPN